MAFEDLEFDESKILEGLQKIADSMGNIEERTMRLESVIAETFGKLADGASTADDAFNKAKQGADKLKDSAKSTTDETKKLQGAVGELAGDMRIFGVNVGSTTQLLKSKATAMGTVIKSIFSGAKALQVFRVALISTGIGAIVVALGTLIAYFGTAEKAMNKVSLVLAGLGGAITGVINTIGKIGGAVLKVFKGDFSGAFDDAKKAVTGFNDEMKKSISIAVQLEARSQALKDRQREAAVATSEVRKQINELNLVASDTTKNFKEREAAQRKLGELEKQLLTENVALRQEELDIILEKNKANPVFADLQAEADARIALNEIQTESFSNQKKQQAALNNLRAEENARIQAAIEKQKELRAELQGMVEDFVAMAAKIERDKLSPADRLQAEADLAIKLVNLEFDKIQAKAKAAGIEVNLEKERMAIIKGLEEKAAEDILEIHRENEERIREEREKRKEDVERLLKEVVDAEAEAIEKEQKRVTDIGNEMAESVKRVMANANRAAEAEANKLNGFELLGRRIAHALGFSSDEEGDEQFAQFLGAISSTIDSVFSAISTKIQSQMEENQAWIDDIREKREQLEEELEIEKQRREEGLANNVDLKEQELQELAKKEAQALKEQEELKKKAVQAQLLQDGASQLSSLVTAAAGIIEGFSKVPILGIALGIAAVASMFAFFATVKARSREAARGDKGGALSDLLGPNAASEDRYGVGKGTYIHPDLIANAREYLVNGDSTMANLDHLHKLNAGMYDNVDLDGFLSSFSPSEIADGFNARARRLDSINGLNSARAFRNTMVQVMGAHTSAVVRAIKDKPYAVAYSPGEHIRTVSGDNVSDIVTAPAEPAWDG